jgi:YVTN family beta-propeller protein
VNFAKTAAGQFAYVTIGGSNEVKVFKTNTFEQVATIAVGALPHGLWPSGDGTRVYVGLENADSAAVIDTTTNKVVANVPIGQGPQGVAYVPKAVEKGDGLANLQPLAAAMNASLLSLAGADGKPVTQVTLFNQGLVQILQAAVTGLEPKSPYVLALADAANTSGPFQPLASFMTNPAGAAIVNAVGPIRQLVQEGAPESRKQLVIFAGAPDAPGKPIQTQKP